MIHLAVSNIAWGEEDDRRMYENLASMGFDGLEIAPSRIWGPNPYENLDEAGEWAGKLRQEYGLVIPSMQSVWYGREENLFRSTEERERLLWYSKMAVKFAEAISCGNLVFGCPRNRNIGNKVQNIDGISKEFFGEIGKSAEECTVAWGIEANPSIYNTNYLNRTEEVAELIGKCGTKGLRINLDLGAMLYYHEPLEKVREWLPLISHVHISEPGLSPIQKRPEHKELFRILLEGNFDRFVSIEMKRCTELETVVAIMEYVKEVCRDAEY